MNSQQVRATNNNLNTISGASNINSLSTNANPISHQVAKCSHLSYTILFVKLTTQAKLRVDFPCKQ